MSDMLLTKLTLQKQGFGEARDLQEALDANSRASAFLQRLDSRLERFYRDDETGANRQLQGGG
jgi:hypothetical protein